MYRTDKRFMSNPDTASSRIYIGAIAEQCVAPDLEDRFKPHGNILGLVLQRGFGFIQYETDGQAQAAIRNEHGSMFFGRKLNVRQAVDRARLSGPQGGGGGPQQTPQRGPPPGIQRGPLSGPQRVPTPPPQETPPPQPAKGPPSLLDKRISPPKQDPLVEEMETNAEEEFGGDKQQESEPEPRGRSSDVNSDTSDRRRHNNNRGRGDRRISRDRDRDRHRDHNRYPDDDFNARDMPPRDLPPRDLPPRDLPPRDLPPRDMPPRDMPPRDMPPRDMPPRDMPPYFGKDLYRPGPPGFVPPPVIDRPERNDCEIIVVSKLLTEYAEYIEQRLKRVGLMVDLLFPNEDVPIGRVLANISSRGCLYAILVMPQNEEFRSLTLSILHGIPQEHRNMPIDDAIVLITRNFDAYMRGDKTGSGMPGSGCITDRHPEQVQMLFNLLAENRQITTSQYDRMLKYLEDRRVLQSQFEIAEGGGEQNSQSEPNSKQAELQSRIMNILNKSADDVPKPVEAPVPQPSGPTPLLNDPTVQKALDSLLSGDMFKTISTSL